MGEFEKLAYWRQLISVLVSRRKTLTLVSTTRSTGKGSTSAIVSSLNVLLPRYGFIHTQTLSKEFDENEKREKEVEVQRAQKWLKMLKNFEKFSSLNREKLERRIYKGIPDKLRGAIWLKLLDVEKSMKENPDMYSRMLSIAHNYSTDIRQIDNDINR